ncbi:MAG: hypothetical protein U9N04_00625 [Patescibacteria group bacterium]|nr:hypothetical protein [Patescibacteria group bacterium]
MKSQKAPHGSMEPISSIEHGANDKKGRFRKAPNYNKSSTGQASEFSKFGGEITKGSTQEYGVNDKKINIILSNQAGIFLPELSKF